MLKFILLSIALFFVIDRIGGFMASSNNQKFTSLIHAEFTNAQKIGRFIQTALTAAIFSAIILWAIPWILE
jgi:uncharacterized membrane protein SpoIIM required for sporulation